MARKVHDLFTPIVAVAKRHPIFEHARAIANGEPARMMMNEVFATFHDADGNFVEQFQTTGFDARTFELYLQAYLSRAQFTIDRRNRRPDFLVERQGTRAAIEATTSNGPRLFEFDDVLREIEGSSNSASGVATRCRFDSAGRYTTS